ncbi:putative MFS family arabinose efflux permease [Curtobacterium sp. PhB130]|uniref:MFS transporter n=1 Tax=unclassified Curtobacterium TaxID=257496 RepID=UPI000F4B0F37|nr:MULTISPECIES: MFS transporter [unclassified Curtobacterium]ROS76096.1 putative MFS family arabinose efflux permease [Curtobacterium sp. PhB130]TCK64207.1 putative MFS family arabinose efflux permease [Curtobacterium sp. PhB136]
MSSPDGTAPHSSAKPNEVPLGIPSGLEIAAEGVGDAVRHGADPLKKISARYIIGLVVATLALYVAWVTPIGYSLSIRVQQIDPVGKNGAIALAIAIPGIIVLFTTPLAGLLSDRTRSRFGRRRPWIIGGVIVGLLGSLIVGFAPSIPLLIVGWSIAYVGYSTAGAMLLTHQSDLIPEEQRGKVSGLTGSVTQIGPIVGILFAGAFVKIPVIMFAAPAAFALIFVLIFAGLMKDKRSVSERKPVDIKSIARGFYFNPRKFPNVGWVWISRALVFLALSFSTTYGVYLLGQRLDITLAEAAPILATSGLIGIVTAIVGAIASGYLSDRFHSRKPFLIASAFILAAGMVVVAFTQSEGQFLVGSALSTLAVGVYGAVDQAIQQDVLPREENENGRFMSIIQLANQVPQAVGPLVAGGIIALATGDYTAVYIVGGIVGILGALAIIPISVGRRSTDSTTSIRAPK